MTRKTKSIVSILATIAATVGIASSAMAADYSSVNAILGGQESESVTPAPQASVNATLGADGVGGAASSPAIGHSSLTAILGAGQRSNPGPSSQPTTTVGLPNAVLGPEGVVGSPAVGATPARVGSDGFHWGDALIGAGIALGLALTAALMLGLTRRRTQAEPGV